MEFGNHITGLMAYTLWFRFAVQDSFCASLGLQAIYRVTVYVWCKQFAKFVPRNGHSGVGDINSYDPTGAMDDTVSFMII